MKYKFVSILTLTLSGFFLGGCVNVVTPLKATSTVAPGAGIVVGRFNTWYNGKTLQKYNVLVASDKGQYQGFVGENGYVLTTLPVGMYWISNIVHPSGLMQHHFASGDLTFQVKGGDVINYIGDIALEWNGMGTASGVAVVGFTGVLGSTLTTGGQIAVSVDSKESEMQAELKRRFATDRKLTPALLKVKSSQ